MKTAWMRCAALALAAALAFAGCSVRTERAPEDPSAASPQQSAPAGDSPAVQTSPAPAVTDTSFEHIAGHIDLPTRQTLQVTFPEEDMELESAAYYITGTSDPALPLTVNGREVEHRGAFGSFGVYVELDWGENQFVFSQGGDARETVSITRAVADLTTNTLTRLSPASDAAARSGDETTLTCTGPSGASVRIEFRGETIPMEQTGVAEADGVPVTFTATFTPGEVSGTSNEGPVTYVLDWIGEERSYQSAGDLYLVGSGDVLLVQAWDVSATTFQDPTTQDDYHTPLQQGAVCVVEEIGAGRYRLAMGGWAPKETVRPLTDATDYRNVIADAQYTVRDSYEMLTLRGTAPAPYSVRREGGTLLLTFHHTSGLEAVDLSGSELFSGVGLTQEGEHETLSLVARDGRTIGYTVQYTGNDTTILFRAQAAAEQGDLPLAGVRILLDAGHGGVDDGASGIARAAGPVEKEITLATTQAVQKYLEAYGATVIMTRADDSGMDLSDRLAMVQQPGVDLMLSLHCNSINAGLDGTGIAGAEVHYYDEISQDMAQSVLDSLCAATGRRSRGTLHSYFKVILSSNVPSMLVEMGFLTNPAEYDQLCDPAEIYKVAQAIADGVVAGLR